MPTPGAQHEKMKPGGRVPKQMGTLATQMVAAVNAMMRATLVPAATKMTAKLASKIRSAVEDRLMATCLVEMVQPLAAVARVAGTLVVGKAVMRSATLVPVVVPHRRTAVLV